MVLTLVLAAAFVATISVLAAPRGFWDIPIKVSSPELYGALERVTRRIS